MPHPFCQCCARRSWSAHDPLRLPASTTRHSPQECASTFHVADTTAVKLVTGNNRKPPRRDATVTTVGRGIATDGKQPKRSAITTEPGRSLARRSPSFDRAMVKIATTASYRALRKFGFGYHNRVNSKVQQFFGFFRTTNKRFQYQRVVPFESDVTMHWRAGKSISC